MAENKQYIAHVQENGTVQICEDVIAAIAAQAVVEVDGVIGFSSKVLDVTELITKRAWGKGLKINVGNENELYIDCTVFVQYGQSVMAIAAAIQDAVISAVESMAGVKVAALNVNICGIARQ